MNASITKPPIWDQIELSESYLVCGMFEEASSLASSILKQLHDHDDKGGRNELVEKYENELHDMLESVGMVLVQSLNGLGRTSEIMNELRLLFGSLVAIPVQVFVTGTCFQISANSSSSVQEFLEEYLSKWRYVDNGYYICSEDGDLCDKYLEVDKYMEVVELYVVTLLSTVKKGMDQAVTWVEKGMLPVEKQQKLLRRLRSMNSSKVTSSTRPSLRVNEDREGSDSMKEEKVYHGYLEHLEASDLTNPKSTTKDAILKLYGQGGRSLWWFRAITLKFGNNRLVISNGNILLGCIALLVYFIMQRRRANLKRYIQTKALTVKKVLLDLRQLAFSYQVNPLAAIQPLPAATHGSR